MDLEFRKCVTKDKTGYRAFINRLGSTISNAGSNRSWIDTGLSVAPMFLFYVSQMKIYRQVLDDYRLSDRTVRIGVKNIINPH